MKAIIAVIWLIFLNIIWGFSFPFMDYLLKDISTFMLMFNRFSISALIMVILFWKPLIQMTKKEFQIVLLISLLYLLGMSLQIIGLSYSNSTNTAFITSLSVLALPIILKILDKAILGKRMMIGILLAAIGISIMTLQANMTFSYGDMIVFLGMISFSFLYYALGKYGSQIHAGALTAVQFLVMTVVSAPFAIAKGGVVFPKEWKAIGILAFLIFVCTVFAVMMHNKIQHYIPTAIVGIIFLIEPLSASAMAWFMGENISIRQIIGAALVIFSVIFTLEMTKEGKLEKATVDVLNL